MANKFVKEVEERIRTVLPKVDTGVVVKGCNEHTFMRNTVVLMLTKKGQELSMPIDRSTWEETGCATNDEAVSSFLNVMLKGFTR